MLGNIYKYHIKTCMIYIATFSLVPSVTKSCPTAVIICIVYIFAALSCGQLFCSTCSLIIINHVKYLLLQYFGKHFVCCVISVYGVISIKHNLNFNNMRPK